MKTLNSVSFVRPSKNSVFTLIGEEVVECRIDQVTLAIEDSEDGKRMVVSHYDIANNEGQITTLASDAVFYDSMNDFRVGNPKSKMCEKGHNVLNTAIGNHLNTKWYFNGVEAVEYEPADNIVKVVVDANFGFTVAEGFVPSEFFKESAHAYAYNDIPTVDIDGKKDVKKGYLSPLLFNEKQKEIMERFKAISKEMREAKIEMFFIEGELSFVNGEHIAEYMASYDRSDEAVDFFPAEEHLDHFMRMDFDCWDPISLELK